MWLRSLEKNHSQRLEITDGVLSETKKAIHWVALEKESYRIQSREGEVFGLTFIL